MTETTDIDFYGKGDPLMEMAFGSCVRWAFDSPEMRERFEEETGVRVARSPMDVMIDQATGFDHEQFVVDRFVRWVAQNVWGE